MNQRTCKIERLSTLEAISDKIMFEIAQPVGIVVFGPTCQLKQETIDALLEKQRQVAESDKIDPHDELRYRFGRQGNIISVMKNSESGCHVSRHEVVTRLREAGMANVVGIYVQTEVELSEPNAEATRKMLELHPPTVDGLDYYVIVPDQH